MPCSKSTFPERRVFLKSDTDTRFIRLRPAFAASGLRRAAAIVAWAIIATAILLMDSIGSGNFREQAKRDQRTYEARLNALSAERDCAPTRRWPHRNASTLRCSRSR